MTPDIWLVLGAGLIAGAMAVLFACLQVAGTASDAADRALARVMLLGTQLPEREPHWANEAEPPAPDDG